MTEDGLAVAIETLVLRNGRASYPEADGRRLAQAATLLRAGELVAFPTDTVYGVGAIAWNREAVGRLYVAKLPRAG